MTRPRLTLLIATAATAALAWSLPAIAHASAATTTVKVTIGKPTEFHFQLSSSSVAKPGTVSFAVTNKGTLAHNFKIDGKKTPTLAPGKSTTLTVTFKKAGRYPYLCTIPGHAAAGMKGTLTVK